jgi:uncharacterized protein YcbX
MKLVSIRRYPIKGLAGESLTETPILPGQTITGDRQFALQYSGRIHPSDNGWRPKKYFLQSVHTNLCSDIQIQWQADTINLRYRDQLLSISRDPIDQEALTRWVAMLDPSLDKLTVERLDSGFTDEPEAYVSLINQATVTAIAAATGTTDHPERYRGNILIGGAPAFEELNWVGQTIAIGATEFEVVEPIVRCRATECDWNGSRTSDFLSRLDQHLQIDTCGLFLKSINQGSIAVNDSLQLINQR